MQIKQRLQNSNEAANDNRAKPRLQHGLPRRFAGYGTGGVLVDCVITDPPYLIEYKTRRRQDKDHKFCKAIKNDDNPQLIIDLIPLLYDVMKDNSPLYMFCGSDKVDFFKTEIEKYFTVKNLIVWDKGNHTAGDLEAQYGKRYEFIIYANKGRAPFNPEMPRYEDIWKFNKVSCKEQIHQNQKPTDLLSRIIRQHTREGDLILDTFGGSCATAVAGNTYANTVTKVGNLTR